MGIGALVYAEAVSSQLRLFYFSRQRRHIKQYTSKSRGPHSAWMRDPEWPPNRPRFYQRTVDKSMVCAHNVRNSWLLADTTDTFLGLPLQNVTGKRWYSKWKRQKAPTSATRIHVEAAEKFVCGSCSRSGWIQLQVEHGKGQRVFYPLLPFNDSRRADPGEEFVCCE